MKLSLDPIWAWPTVLLSCLLLAGVVAIAYPRRVRHLPGWRPSALLALRVGVVLVLLFWMLRPSVILESHQSSNAVLYVVHDVSRSMLTSDVPGGITRYAAQQHLLSDAQEYLDELEDSVEIRFRSFAETLKETRRTDAAAHNPDGQQTSISNCLEQLIRETGSTRLAGILFLSDGRQAATGAAAQDPLPFARLLGRQHNPIYAVAFGSPEVSSTSLDVAVSELDVARDAFVRNVVPVRVRVNALGAAGRSIRMRVFLEEPEQQDGRLTPMTPMDLVVHKPASDASDQFVELRFVPQVPGEFKVAVEAEPLPDEVRPTNNRVETIISVRTGGIRVAYFDILRPEQRWVRSITVSSRIQLDFQPVFTGRLAHRNEFDDSWFVPGNVDAFIIGDVPADVLGKDRLDAIEWCCRQGAGLMMTGGVQNFGAGNYHRYPLGRLLPVDVAATVDQLTEPVSMRPTQAGLFHSIMQIAGPEENQQRWEDLPPLSGATLLRLKPEQLAQELAETHSGTPLLVGHEIGHSRVLTFGGDTTWQWSVQRGDAGEEAAQRFWRQVIFWLTRQEQDSDAPVWATAEPRDMIPGQVAELRYGARDANGLPITDASWDVQITRPDRITESVPAGNDAGQGVSWYPDTSQPGDYRVRVTATHEGESVGLAMTRFLVNHRDPELDNPSANPDLLRELAYLSGGDFLTPEELLKRLRKWADEGPPILEVKHSERRNLWDNWFTLLVFTGLLTGEWALRRKNGLV